MNKTVFLLLLLLLPISDAAAQEWVQTNGPTAAEFYSIAFNSKKDIFVSAGKIIRSTDHGTSWKRIAADLPEGSIGYIVIAANDDIYISNATSTNTGYSYETYKSTDNGDTWVGVSSKTGNVFGHYKNTIYGFGRAQDTIWYLFRSSDAGNSWDSLYFIPKNFGYPAIDSNGVLIV